MGYAHDVAGERRGRDGEAVVMRRYGPPAVLGVERVALPALSPDEICVRSLASAINHSDLEIRAGPPRRGAYAGLIRFLTFLGWRSWVRW